MDSKEPGTIPNPLIRCAEEAAAKGARQGAAKPRCEACAGRLLETGRG